MDPGPLRDDLNLEAWEPPAPPQGFAERVMVRVEATRRASRRARIVRRSAAVMIPLAAAAAALLAWPKPVSHGDVSAEERRTFALGSRATVVAEAGSHLGWHGDEVTQDRGDVFYRVEPGARFRVHTPAGDVEVRGTCFRVKVGVEPMNQRDMKSGAVGAALSAMAFVGVYEGKVAVSRGAESVEVGAGEAARADAQGVRRESDVDGAKRAFDTRTAPEDDPMLRANANLAASVKEYKKRLESIEAERRRLEERLELANAQLGATDAGPPSPNKAYDLSNEDWNELAKEGTVKFRMPCSNEKGWVPSTAQRDNLGLAPDDVEVLRDAYARSYARVWADIRPICAEVLSPEVADKLGPTNCPNAIVSILTSSDWARLSKTMRDVAEMRAGTQPLPAQPPADPVTRVFLRWTAEMGLLEQDLAAQLGPEQAHRIVYSDSICAWNSTWPGSGAK